MKDFLDFLCNFPDVRSLCIVFFFYKFLKINYSEPFRPKKTVPDIKVEYHCSNNTQVLTCVITLWNANIYEKEKCFVIG